MIKIHIFRNENNEVYGFDIKDHALDIVCSAVSMIAINTVNSIDIFTDIDFECEYEDEGGYIHLEVPLIKNGEHNHDVNLLLNSLVLGLRGVAEEYKDDAKLIDDYKEVQQK